MHLQHPEDVHSKTLRLAITLLMPVAFVHSTVHNLNDNTFEHDTQASTGATTGDWLVAFGSTESLKLSTFESLAAEHATDELGGIKFNVAVVNLSKSPELMERFRMQGTSQTILLFHKGSMFEYPASRPSTAASLAEFALGGYKEVPTQQVPKEKQWWEKMLQTLGLGKKEL